MPKVLVKFDTTCDDNDGEPVALTEDMASFGGESGDRFCPAAIQNGTDAVYEVSLEDLEDFFVSLDEDASWCVLEAGLMDPEEG